MRITMLATFLLALRPEVLHDEYSAYCAVLLVGSGLSRASLEMPLWNNNRNRK